MTRAELEALPDTQFHHWPRAFLEDVDAILGRRASDEELAIYREVWVAARGYLAD